MQGKKLFNNSIIYAYTTYIFYPAVLLDEYGLKRRNVDEQNNWRIWD